MRNAGRDEAQAGIQIAGRNINNLRYANDTTLMAESEEELKCPLMTVKEESEKAGLKLYIQKTKIKVSSPITSWQRDGKTMETMTDFIFLGSKITADSDCSHEIKRCLLRGRKAMTNLDSVLKSRDITLLTKVHKVKAMVFPIVMYGCESWTIKKAECQRTDAFEMLEKTLESPLDCKEIQPVHPKGNQSQTFIGRTDAETEAPILWLPHAKSQLIRKDPEKKKRKKGPWFWERLKAGEVDDRGPSDGWITPLTQQTWVWASSRKAWCATVHGVSESDTTEWLNNSNNKLIFWWRENRQSTRRKQEKYQIPVLPWCETLLNTRQMEGPLS